MSSSRIIKSVQADPSAVGEFAFRPIGQAASAQAAGQASGFVPLGIFDMSEIGGAGGAEQELEQPGVTMTEEEYKQRLHASFEQGLQEGKNLAERGLVNVFRSLRSAAEGVHDLREKVLRESEDELIRLIMMIARKVILKEVTQDRGILSSVVRAGIASLSDRDEITIRLHPDDYLLVTTSPNDSLRQDLTNDRMRLKADPMVQPGGCQIDTDMGTLDASIDAQLDEVYRRLLEERSSSGEGV